ncbi:hypothetical protein OnM2_008005 [Erysiphe neolycopersici]|uniref:DRBM domain-containing protein n=1 Tax=Erysiphe neolycopersici TaxID=212602 RepID=A0A420I6W9_9PEZI|nr:hypothetical protein OnM2_008005 [Erysiphe neolycopersici]
MVGCSGRGRFQNRSSLYIPGKQGLYKAMSNQNLLEELCRKMKWDPPIYNVQFNYPGHFCTISVCGKLFEGLISLADFGAREYAAGKAYEELSRLAK